MENLLESETGKIIMSRTNKIDLALLDVDTPTTGDKNIKFAKKRYDELVSQGYELIELHEVGQQNQIKNSAKSAEVEVGRMFLYGSDKKEYETKAVIAFYRQATKKETKYGKWYFDFLTNSITKRVVDVLAGLIPKAGWVPAALGISASSVSDFIARGQINYIIDSSLFCYDIYVRLKGTEKFYMTASASRLEMAITGVSSNFTDKGSPVQRTVSGTGFSQSTHYQNQYWCSNTAVNYLVTGGPYKTYIYEENYPNDTPATIDLS